MQRHICFLVYPGFVLLDLSGPLEAFSNANRARPPGYRFTVASLEGGLISASSGLQVATEALQVVDQLERLRIESARPLVEDGLQTFEEIARCFGFGDADHMLRSFVRVVGRTPQELRRSARQAKGNGSGKNADPSPA
ncbi:MULTISPECIES: helix-turn-helix domain-containing protein [Pseudomonas]|uniref:HTH araC/xylS-type domain-containing protein n=1 Tax=Pseudomonas fluorescens TaxID=294 RepID=A0A0F4U344_PSEFL|nr:MULTISPECIES: helix-turn-helix domain-containing protein [Pseudomonas]KJZ50640.1 hypothetical protein VC35_00185 [Pseudomonas fluorescens]